MLGRNFTKNKLDSYLICFNQTVSKNQRKLKNDQIYVMLQ